MFPRIELQSDHAFYTPVSPLSTESYPVPAHRKHDAYVLTTTAIGLLFSLSLVTGCSAKNLDDTPAAVAPAQPAESPPLSQAPAGMVRPLDGRPQTAIFDGRTAQLVIVTPGSTPAAPASLTLLGSQQTSQRVVDLPGPATGLTGDNHGTAYLSTRGGYFVVDLSAGQAVRVSVGDAVNVEFTAITRPRRRHGGVGYRRRHVVHGHTRRAGRTPDKGPRAH